jgi:hypothetical protein
LGKNSKNVLSAMLLSGGTCNFLTGNAAANHPTIIIIIVIVCI